MTPDVWHLRKEISVGHILTTVVVATSMLAWAYRVENRTNLLEQSLVLHREAPSHGKVLQRLFSVETQIAVSSNTIVEMDKRLERIEDKLDQLLGWNRQE